MQKRKSAFFFRFYGQLLINKKSNVDVLSGQDFIMATVVNNSSFQGNSSDCFHDCGNKILSGFKYNRSSIFQNAHVKKLSI